jgi:hypothetical protein
VWARLRPPGVDALGGLQQPAGGGREEQIDRWWSRKPSSVRSTNRAEVISLGWRSPASSSGLPAAQTVRAGPHRLFGLAPTGGCRATAVASCAVGSYPTVSPLPGVAGRFVFCGPVRRLAAPRRYLAVCPVELGLSSSRLRGPRPSHPTTVDLLHSKDSHAATMSPPRLGSRPVPASTPQEVEGGLTGGRHRAA